MNTIMQLLENTALVWGISVDDVKSLLSLPRTRSVRVNYLKVRKGTLSELARDGIELDKIAWAPNCYRAVNGYEKLSTHPTVLNGEVFLQNAASFLPVLALDPKPGDDILDICAAPGGKTTHIAAITKNRARITANDASRVRFFKMREIFERYGVRAETTLYDGRYLRKQFADQQFDKILLDAPCSGEAAINPNNPKTYVQWSLAKVKRLSRLQEQLIVIAYDLLKPGGTLVYSTCTIAPEENECVVNYLLKRRKAEIVPISVAIDAARPGLTEWRGRRLNTELSMTLRLLPSELHEAFYTAKLIKPLTDTEDEDEYRLA